MFTIQMKSTKRSEGTVLFECNAIQSDRIQSGTNVRAYVTMPVG